MRGWVAPVQAGEMSAAWGNGCHSATIFRRIFSQVSHHIQCNDEALDEDVFSAFPALRFDARLPRRPWHQWQHIYMVRRPIRRLNTARSASVLRSVIGVHDGALLALLHPKQAVSPDPCFAVCQVHPPSAQWRLAV